MSAALTIALLFVGAASAFLLIARRQRARLQRACTAACEETFAGLSPAPVFKMSYVYSFPAFTVTFANPNQLNDAKVDGRLDRFNAAIQRLCKDQGAYARPFAAEQAIHYSYFGQP